MLKYIKQHAASIEGIGIYPIISLLIFVIFFAGMIWWVRKLDKKSVASISRIPLDGTESENPITHPIK